MKLKRIEIKNFRSLKDQQLTFDRNFQVLVGINESGKTNLIKAVSLLNEDIKFSRDDIRDPGHDEGAVTESYVRFVFKIERLQLDKYIKSVENIILASDLKSTFLEFNDTTCDIGTFCRMKDEVLYVVNLINEKRSITHWAMPIKRYRIHPNWKKVKDGSSHPIEHRGKSLNISNYSIVNINEFTEIPDSLIEDLDIHSLNTIVGEHLVNVSKDSFPICILWNYSEDNLLPGRVNLAQFTANPEMCVPLKNMFTLAGYHNVTKSLQDASQKTNGLRNILRKVSENTTSHMKKVWPEWKKQKITLVENGDFIDAGIEDEYNIYSLSRRSDGFKRFLTFLLMISVQNRTEEIFDNLIVIDEPDIGLHPSGVQYLREELKRIGENNIVLVSTHSIFMIDKEIVDRHLIVEKEKKITKISRVNVSNISDEEVVYKALGYSLYELLKPKNIIFEGWRDKKCFEKILKSKNGKKLFPRETVSTLGLLHSFGVKDIARVANTCELFYRDYVIISDSDRPAKEKRKVFEGSGKWFCYDDINSIEAITTEDFMSNELLDKAIREVFKNNDIDHSLTMGEIVSNKIAYIENELKNISSLETTSKELLNQIKEYSCINATANDFDARYLDVCKFLIQIISE